MRAAKSCAPKVPRWQRPVYPESVSVEQFKLGRLQEMRAIADRCARLLGPGPPAIKHGDKLYDDQGLPR